MEIILNRSFIHVVVFRLYSDIKCVATQSKALKIVLFTCSNPLNIYPRRLYAYVSYLYRIWVSQFCANPLVPLLISLVCQQLHLFALPNFERDHSLSLFFPNKNRCVCSICIISYSCLAELHL